MAATFKDVQGREWTVRITGETLCQATSRGIDLDLNKLMSGKLSLQALGVVLELCWLGVQHNARVAAGQASESDFKAALHGKTMSAALLAAQQALAECFGMEVAPADPTAGSGKAKAKPAAST
jgi:hypothetical protein